MTFQHYKRRGQGYMLLLSLQFGIWNNLSFTGINLETFLFPVLFDPVQQWLSEFVTSFSCLFVMWFCPMVRYNYFIVHLYIYIILIRLLANFNLWLPFIFQWQICIPTFYWF